jgi:hypothetical protein
MVSTYSPAVSSHSVVFKAIAVDGLNIAHLQRLLMGGRDAPPWPASPKKNCFWHSEIVRRIAPVR